MYNLWQVAGGKVEYSEFSLQVVLRKTKKEMGLTIAKKKCNYLTNDPEYNCDVYITKYQIIKNYNEQKLKNMDLGY